MLLDKELFMNRKMNLHILMEIDIRTLTIKLVQMHWCYIFYLNFYYVQFKKNCKSLGLTEGFIDRMNIKPYKPGYNST